jgi:asparagine synthase (glutamine-hydrolysing)
MIDFSLVFDRQESGAAYVTCSVKNTDESGIEIAFTGKLSNAQEIAFSLSLSSKSDLNVLLRAAWRRWGDALPDKLRGSFLLVVFDQLTGQLFVARDAMGIMPTYYAASGHMLIIGNSSRAVRALVPIVPALDLAQLADFLCGEESGYERTFFEGIKRLPPGHWLKCLNGQVIIEKYWMLESVGSVALALPEQTERFQELFDKSLASQYVSGKTAILMSGGLDSSMIAGSVAHALKGGPEVLALSMTYPGDPNWNDGPHIESLRRYLPFSFADLPGNAHDPLSNLELHLQALDGPYISFGHSETFAGKSFLAGSGYNLVLNGHGGDEIVSHGDGRLNELAMARKWSDLWRETEPLSKLHGVSRWQLFSPYLSHIQKIRTIRNKFSQFAPLPSDFPRQHPLLTDTGLTLVRENFGAFKNPMVVARDHTERSLHIEAVTSAIYARAFEVTAISSAAVGVETLMPFCDRDLVEFSVSLPSETKLGGGFTRRILREAMSGRVPESVRTRANKYDFTRPFVDGLLSVNSRMDDLVDAHSGVLAELIDLKELHRLRSEVLTHQKSIRREDAFNVWRVLVAAKWIEILKSPQPKNG